MEKSRVAYIRKATVEDIDSILDIYEASRQFMRTQGNMTQWTNGYPSRGHVTRDIESDCCFVGCDEDGRIVMAFAFIIGADPTYEIIENGKWLNDRPYGTIHRLGSDGSCRDVLHDCLEYCFKQINNIRVDTHRDNRKMLELLNEEGFVHCGLIYCQDGTPREAFQKIHI